MLRHIKLFWAMRRRIKIIQSVIREYDRLKDEPDTAAAFTVAMVCAISSDGLEKSFRIISELQGAKNAESTKIN